MSEDQEFDQSLCECVFSHEFAMRRLLNLLRNGQSSCTEIECTDLTRPQNVSGSNENADNFTFMMFILIAAVILYLIRPNSLRRQAPGKPSSDNGPNDQNDPMVN